MVIVLWIVATVTFVLMHATPGGPWDAMCKPGGPTGRTPGEPCQPKLRHTFEATYGLDKPLIVQYLDFLKGIGSLDFGESIEYKQADVSGLLLQGFAYSARIGTYGFVLAVIVGIPLGVASAFRQNTWLDLAFRAITAAAYGIPSFVLAIFLVVVFAVKLNWVPVIWSDWRSYIIPSVVLGTGPLAMLARISRVNVLEVLTQDYVRAARARGLKRATLHRRHVIRNALLPVVTLTGPILATLVMGSIVVENVLGIPGMGYIYVHGIVARDYPIIMGATLSYALLIATCNLVVDIAYGALDPRIRAA